MMYRDDDDNINFVLAKTCYSNVCFSILCRGSWTSFGTLKSYNRERMERSILRGLNSYYQIVVRWL